MCDAARKSSPTSCSAREACYPSAPARLTHGGATFVLEPRALRSLKAKQDKREAARVKKAEAQKKREEWAWAVDAKFF